MDFVARNTSISSILELAEALGASRSVLLQKVGMSPETAVRAGADVPSAALQDLFALGALETGRKDFGLEWGARNNRHLMGPLTILLENSGSIREAIGECANFLHIHNTATNYTVVPGRERDRLTVEVVAKGRYSKAQFTEAVLTSMLFMWRTMMGSEWAAHEVWFEHERQGSRSDYQRAFGCPVLFGQQANCMVAPKADFETRITKRDERIRSFMQGMLHELDRVYSGDLPAKIRMILLGLIPAGRATSTEVARKLVMSARTMQRHLAEHGTSIRQLVIEERIRMATEHLARPDATVSGLVTVLGFSEVSAVSRFLKEHGIDARPRHEPARARLAVR